MTTVTERSCRSILQTGLADARAISPLPALRLRRDVRSVLPGARIVKTAIAVGMAWWVGTMLGEPRPLFAALGALVGMETTVVGSLRRTVVQIAGTIGGLVVALLVVQLMGVSWLGAGLAVLLSLGIGKWLGSPDRVGVELAFAALLLVGFAEGDARFGFTRLWEAAIGGMVAAAVNALILPPDYLRRLQEELDLLSTEMARGLRETAHTFVERPEHQGAAEIHQRLREARTRLESLESQFQMARESLRLSPFQFRSQPLLERAQSALRLYASALHHATSLARIVEEHAARTHDWPHSNLRGPHYLVGAAEALAVALVRYQAYVRSGDPESLSDARRYVSRAQAALTDFLHVAERERAFDIQVRSLVDIAAFASELEHLVYSDFPAALGAVSTYREAPPPAAATSPAVRV